MHNKDPKGAIEALHVARSYELGTMGSMDPTYLRGLAHLEFGNGSESGGGISKDYRTSWDPLGIGPWERWLISNWAAPMRCRAMLQRAAPFMTISSSFGKTPIQIFRSLCKPRRSTKD